MSAQASRSPISTTRPVPSEMIRLVTVAPRWAESGLRAWPHGPATLYAKIDRLRAGPQTHGKGSISS
jgi:hypothetical protein